MGKRALNVYGTLSFFFKEQLQHAERGERVFLLQRGEPCNAERLPRKLRGECGKLSIPPRLPMWTNAAQLSGSHGLIIKTPGIPAEPSYLQSFQGSAPEQDSQGFLP